MHPSRYTKPNLSLSKLTFESYRSVLGGLLTVFPFHTACYKLLGRVISGRINTTVDEENLYAAFVRLSDEYSTWHLDIDYGSPCPRDNRSWITYLGHELDAPSAVLLRPTNMRCPQLLVKNPIDAADISAHLVNQQFLPEVLASSSVLQDPFDRLPHEIRQHLLELLSNRDIAAVRTASYPMHTTIPSKAVWKRLIAAHMPWLWEMDAVISRGAYRELNLSRTIRELENWTTFGDDKTDTFSLALANRRRIWSICEIIADEYDKVTDECKVATTREWVDMGDGCFELQIKP